MPIKYPKCTCGHNKSSHSREWCRIFRCPCKRYVAPGGLFYIQDTRTYCGNSVIWWRKGGHGYTSNLEEAEKVTADWKGRPTDRLWPCEEIDARATLQFDAQLLSEVEAINRE